jgi:MFS family permease
MEIPTGMIGDLIGRKFSRIIGVLFLILYTVLVLVGNEFWVIALAFFICGVGYTFESGSGEALIYDSLIELKKEDTFMKIQGRKEILFQTSSSIGLLVGGWIAVVTFDLNFIVMIFVLAIALIPILLMTEISQYKSDKKRTFKQLVNEHFINSTNVVFQNKRLLFLILIFAFMLAPITSMFFYVQKYLLELDFTILHVGIILGVHSAAGAVGGIIANRLEKKYKEKLILYFVPIFIVLSFWTVLIDQIVFIPFILMGLLDSIFYIVLSDYMNRLIPSQQRATVLSFSNLMFSVVMIVIFPVIGLIADFSTLRVAFTLLAIVVTITYIALVFLLKSSTFNKQFS